MKKLAKALVTIACNTSLGLFSTVTLSTKNAQIRPWKNHFNEQEMNKEPLSNLLSRDPHSDLYTAFETIKSQNEPTLCLALEAHDYPKEAIDELLALVTYKAIKETFGKDALFSKEEKISSLYLESFFKTLAHEVINFTEYKDNHNENNLTFSHGKSVEDKLFAFFKKKSSDLLKTCDSNMLLENFLCAYTAELEQANLNDPNNLFSSFLRSFFVKMSEILILDKKSLSENMRSYLESSEIWYWVVLDDLDHH